MSTDKEKKEFVLGSGMKLAFEDPNAIKLNQYYPVYGYISTILEDTEDRFAIEVNENICIEFPLEISRKQKDDITKRVFDSGIFMVKFTMIILGEDNKKIKHPYIGECQAITFTSKTTNYV